jgi:ParB family chromosome partitioning protein
MMPLTIADAELMMLPLHGDGGILADPAIQQRVALDPAKLEEYAALYVDGHDLGRLVVFTDGQAWLLADGFHRHNAARRAGLAALPCAVYQGSRRDALLYATSCNLHGVPLTNADKWKRVTTLLSDPTWVSWSDNAIAKHCGVTQPFVGTVRKSLITVISEDTPSPSLITDISEETTSPSLITVISENGQRTYTDRYGWVSTMHTGAIGHQPRPEPLVLEPEDPAEDETTAPATGFQAVYSGDDEWYTPEEILDLARAVLGTIDVDPASCDLAQARVQARTYYTLADNGLLHPWHGVVLLNPPYRKHGCEPFINKLCVELDAQHTTAAILVVNNATETDWFQTAFARAAAVCFPDGRQSFLHATKNSHNPVRGHAILYYGPHPERFCAVFAALGVSTRVRCVEAALPQLTLAAAPAPGPAPVPAEAAPRLRDQVGTLQAAVLQTVQQLQPCTNAQVKAALGEERPVVWAALKALVKQGKILKEGQTYRAVAEQGAA